MKMRIQDIFFFSVLVIVLAACSKGGTATDDGDGNDGQHVLTPTDVTAPIIEIATPAANQVFLSGNLITITGKLTDDYGLYRGSIRITNDANGTVLKEQLYEIHGLLLYNYSISYTANVTASADYTVTVTFEDHGLNTSTKSVKIKVNP
jgi:phosphate-selective porin